MGSNVIEMHQYIKMKIYQSISREDVTNKVFLCFCRGVQRNAYGGGGSPGGESCLYVCCNPINAVFALSISCCSNLLSEVKTRQGRKTEEQKN